MEEQQEMYHMMTRDFPQSLRETIRMLQGFRGYIKHQEQQKEQKRSEVEQAKHLREQLGQEVTPEMEEEFLNLPDSERREILRELQSKVYDLQKNERMLNDLAQAVELRKKLGKSTSESMEESFKKMPEVERKQLIREMQGKLSSLKLEPGERPFDFLMRDGRMLAEPQTLAASVNLEQLKNVLNDYGMQFHIKELRGGERELHFFAKDANIAAKSLEKTVEEITKNPEKVTEPSLEDEIKTAKAQEKAKVKEVEEKVKAKAKEQQVQAQRNGSSTQTSPEAGSANQESIDNLMEMPAPPINPFEGGPEL